MRKTILVPAILVLAAALATVAAAASPQAATTPKGGTKPAPKPPTTREMSLLCWQEFGELVPASIDTVLVPFGSLEPHGVIPNGTDSLAPAAMAKDIAERVNALIAPVLNYGMTEAMKAYPGAVSIPAEIYGPFAESVLDNLALQGFKNIIVLNGHGGNSTLNASSTRVANARRVRVLVINWWTLADDITKSVFKQNGGHAGNNETAYIQAFLPEAVHPERYKPEMASPNPAPPGSYYTAPVESTILLYEKGQGYPTFDPAQAKEYFRKVNDRVAGLILDTIAKWNMAGVYR